VGGPSAEWGVRQTAELIVVVGDGVVDVKLLVAAEALLHVVSVASSS
jgi:hypothetical protein